MKRSQMSLSTFAIPERRAYPINTPGRARNAIARVQQHGTASEKRRVYAKIRRRYPAIANRSKVIPTRTGTGRHFGQAKGTSNKGRKSSSRRRSSRSRRR
jgi:hypothetical protein